MSSPLQGVRVTFFLICWLEVNKVGTGQAQGCQIEKNRCRSELKGTASRGYQSLFVWRKLLTLAPWFKNPRAVLGIASNLVRHFDLNLTSRGQGHHTIKFQHGLGIICTFSLSMVEFQRCNCRGNRFSKLILCVHNVSALSMMLVNFDYVVRWHPLFILVVSIKNEN